jgi:hypothetical protein
VNPDLDTVVQLPLLERVHGGHITGFSNLYRMTARAFGGPSLASSTDGYGTCGCFSTARNSRTNGTGSS